jgi:hypothetical protein
MSLQQTPARTSVSAQAPRAAPASLSGSWLLLARVTWGTVVVLALGIGVASLPTYTAFLDTVCVRATCSFARLTPTTVQALSALGLSHDSYVALTLTLTAVFAAVCWTVGGVLVWRKSHDRMALLAALMLILLSTTNVTRTVGEGETQPVVALLFLDLLTVGVVFLVFSLFPDGRFVPRWTLWLTLGFFGWRVLFFLLPTWPFVGWLDNLMWAGSFGGLAIAQVYRYVRVSGSVERQQTKWVVFGFTITTLVGVLPGPLLSTFSQPGSLFEVINEAVFNVVSLLLPLSIGIAILRYRLWDIDVLIHRTLVYGTLTGTLALVYVGSILLLQYLLRGLTQGYDVAIVGSTLVIAALFQPLRRRIQQTIDRRFYRRKYDAVRILAAFSATLRNEVDLHQLREQLVAVVQETMQPTSVSLWLRPPEHDGTHRAPWRANPPVSSEGR